MQTPPQWQPALARNYFELFGLDAMFALDTEALDRSYRELQTQVHPDRFAHLGDTERRLAMQWASLTNEAYRTLKSPTERARHLLQLQSESTESPPALSTEFLMQQMEHREVLAAARNNRDRATLHRLENEIRAEMQIVHERLADALDERKDTMRSLELVQMLQFCDKLLTDIADIRDDFD